MRSSLQVTAATNKLLKEMNFFTIIVRVLWNMLGEQLHHQQSFFQNFIDVISLRVFQWRYSSHAWHDSNVDSFILSSEVNMLFQQKLGSLYTHCIHARDTAQCCRPCAKQSEPLFVKIGFVLTNFWPPETRKALGARLQIASCANVHGSSHSWYGIVACFKLIRTCFSKFLLLQNWPRTVHLCRAQFPRICQTWSVTWEARRAPPELGLRNYRKLNALKFIIRHKSLHHFISASARPKIRLPRRQLLKWCRDWFLIMNFNAWIIHR